MEEVMLSTFQIKKEEDQIKLKEQELMMRAK